MAAAITGHEQYCLRWNNHGSNLLSVFDELLQNEAFTDVTLAVDGGTSVRCHKMVLAACSSYFQSLFFSFPCKHPIVILKDVKYPEMRAILEYMYRGEVNVAHDQLTGLLKIAEALRVKGLIQESAQIPERICPNDETETTLSTPPAISTTSNAAQSNGSPHSSDSFNMYGKSPADRPQDQSDFPLKMWALAGLSIPQRHPAEQQQPPHPQHTSSFSGSYDAAYENASPVKRKKYHNPHGSRDTPILRTVLGQGHAEGHHGLPLLHPDNHYHRSSNGSITENDRRNSTDMPHTETGHSPYTDASGLDDDEKHSPPSYATDSKSGIVNYVPAQKPEWKRYKQYTRNDIMSAIEAVRTGMSALQAARKYGVPSRTLYDKVKKLGITTSRPFKRGSNGGSACFPYGIGGNVNGGIYASTMSESETESSNALDTPGSSYSKVRDLSINERETAMDVTRCSPSPRIHPSDPGFNHQSQSNEEDQVEDLSINRKPDVRVIVPTAATVKEEEQEVPDNPRS